jgi:hypothetical protein
VCRGDIEDHEAAFFLDGKRKLFAVGFPFSFQIGMIVSNGKYDPKYRIAVSVDQEGMTP